MKAQSFKRFLPLFAFFIMFAGARAADYLWDPKLLWESKESYQVGIYGMQFINDDKEVLYSADGKNYVRDAQTGEILKQSDQFDMEMGSFRFTKDNKHLFTFGDATYLGQRKYKALLRFDAQTLTCLDSLPVFMKYLKTIYNEKELSIVSIDNYAVISDDRIIFLCTTREQGPEYPFYNYCLISFNPQKKDFSWDNKDDWKIEYYFVPKENSTSNPPIITRDYKFLIYQGPSKVNIIDLETLKTYSSFPGYYLVAANPSLENIFIVNHNDAIIYNIYENRKIYSFDYRLLNTLEYTTASISNLILDSSKILFDKPGTPFYDLTDSKSKILYNKEKYSFPYNYNLNHNTEMFIDEVYHSNSGTHVTLYKLENATSGSVNSNTDDFDTIKSTGDKLIIPFNGINPKEIIIYNSDGKLIKQFITFDSDKENVYLNISFLNQGVYFVTVISESGSKANYKFMKGE